MTAFPPRKIQHRRKLRLPFVPVPFHSARVRIGREQLIFKALCALDEAVDHCDSGPVKPSVSLRFALAYLYAVSAGDRTNFDDFYRSIQQPEKQGHVYQSNYTRATAARIQLTAICRCVGTPLTVELMIRLRQARLPKAAREQELAKERTREDAIAARIKESEEHARGRVSKSFHNR